MTNKRKDYYQVLHVQPDAPAEVIRASYRTMMQQMKMHPDLGGDHEAAALVNEAYKVLTNPVAKAKYDASLKKTGNDQSTPNKENASQKDQSKKYPAYNATVCSFCQAAHGLADRIENNHNCTQCGSVLYPATKHVHDKNDQRIIQRIDKQWPLMFCVDWPNTESYAGQTQDVSLNGLQMITDTKLEIGQPVKISSSFLDAVARVVNIREDSNVKIKQWRVGLEFLTLRFHETRGTFLSIDA